MASKERTAAGFSRGQWVVVIVVAIPVLLFAFTAAYSTLKEMGRKRQERRENLGRLQARKAERAQAVPPLTDEPVSESHDLPAKAEALGPVIDELVSIHAEHGTYPVDAASLASVKELSKQYTIYYGERRETKLTWGAFEPELRLNETNAIG